MRDIDVLAPVIGKSVSHRTFNTEKAGKTQSHSGESLAFDYTSPLAEYVNTHSPVVCAYSGGNGAYAEQAIQHYFGKTVTPLAEHNFRGVMDAVISGRASLGMLPIENSLAGSVYENYDNLARYEDIEVVGTFTMRIEHSLLSVKGSSPDKITAVYSHPQGLAQCSDFLAGYPDWERIETDSTSSAAQMVAESGDKSRAAIASGATAPIYHLEILKSGIESNPRNYTRFVIIARTGEIVASAPNTASVIFSTANEPGSLYRVLGLFAKYGLNLTKLESRPVPGEPWQYRFYANLTLPEGVGSSVVAAERIRSAIAEMKDKNRAGNSILDVRVLGLYSVKE
ncbi:hypothetical protein K7I13_03265 [Brucepastera parasyntrophica]|nr:prephenate dehydratase domain-containing protein [Brucepastera parasyntrophica]ULQ61122.1 hypothetical protein K7I13_03265 [Brucepastera parasyntrophica]